MKSSEIAMKAWLWFLKSRQDYPVLTDLLELIERRIKDEYHERHSNSKELQTALENFKFWDGDGVYRFLYFNSGYLFAYCDKKGRVWFIDPDPGTAETSHFIHEQFHDAIKINLKDFTKKGE